MDQNMERTRAMDGGQLWQALMVILERIVGNGKDGEWL
jgi:hypothetical protein